MNRNKQNHSLSLVVSAAGLGLLTQLFAREPVLQVSAGSLALTETALLQIKENPARLSLDAPLTPQRLGPQTGTFYQNARSYSTTRDPDPPKYARNFSQTWLASLSGQYVPDRFSWLDIGLDYRFRYEYRENDLRLPKAVNRPNDTPILHRTRFYLGVKDRLDPFRFAVEIQDSRRSRGIDVRPVPQSDEINHFEPIRLYGELYFEDVLGHDSRSNARPFSLRYGIHNFEFLDRRLIGNNQWRNTANTFRGFHSSLGQESNDWQLDLLAVQPLNRLATGLDRPLDPKWLYGAVGHWRGWSEHITLEPFYLQLRQSQYIGSDGKAYVNRVVHTPGLRGYGVFGKSGFDFDFSVIPQFGHKDALPTSALGAKDSKGSATRAAESIRAFAATVELGYTLERHDWKPRLSGFYGFASGDQKANPELDGSPPKAPAWDLTDNRFERFYGFQRPWSANDYIVFENISSPKLRLDFKPSKDLRVDLGYSWYFLASGADRFYRAEAGKGTARDYFERGGKNIGGEFDARARYNWSKQTEITLGYAHFEPGRYIETKVRPGASNFGYLEVSYRFF